MKMILSAVSNCSPVHFPQLPFIESGNNYAVSLGLIDALRQKTDNVAVSTASSLLHVPFSTEGETALDPAVLKHFAFAVEKLTELKEIAVLADSDEDAKKASADLAANQALFDGTRVAADPAVAERIAKLTDADFVRQPARAERQKEQRVALGPEIAADAKERFGFEKCCTDWRDIVNDPEIDVVSICTPNNVHAEIAIAALNAGKHVLCEKPIASTLEDAKAMAEAAKKAAQKGIIAMNAYQYRRVPAIDLAKKFIDEGSIGKILNVRCTYLQSWSADPASPLSWRFQKDIAGAGTLGDIASHVIDIAQYLAGDIEAVTGMMQTYITERPVQEGGTDLLGTVKLGADAKRKAVDVDDEDSFLVKFKNGAVGSPVPLATKAFLSLQTARH